MESEIGDEIPEYSMASLHADGTENVLNKKGELLKDNYSEKETKLTSIQVVVDAPGQVVPARSSSCLKPETEASQNNERSTVPQGTLEVMDCREESEHFSNIHQHELLEGKEFEQLTSTLSINICGSTEQENAMKTFLWPPIGFKDQITEQRAPISEPDTFEQVVLRRNDENNDITIAEQVPFIINNVNQSEEHSSQEENNKLTSILKKNDSGLKKTVHFPQNIVSVKFYEISDEEDSDNDTVILEEDDLRDQEVPFNTCGDYDSNCCHPSSTSMNFIPQFTFPPVLKIANCQLYEDVDDHDEQIMAIMEDDDGSERLHANDLAADEIYHQEDTSCFQDDPLTSQEVITLSKNSDDVFHEERRIAPAEVRKLSKNPEEELEIMETHTPLIKNGIERNEDHLEMNAYKNMNGTFEVEILEVNQRTPTKDKTLSEHIPIEPQSINEHQNDQLTSNKVKTISKNPKEIEMNAPTTNNEVGPLEKDLEIKTNKYVDETLESESSVVKENPSILATFNKGIENPAGIENSSCVNNETNIKVPKVDAPELGAKVYTLLDALKATPKNSIAITMEERSTEENFVQQATSPERVLEGTMASMILLPESQIPEFNAQCLDKMQTELTERDMVKEWLIAIQTPDIVSHDETFTVADVSFGKTENFELQATNMTGLSEEKMVKKRESTTEPANVIQNDVSAESKENSDCCMEATPSGSSPRAFHGNCGSKFLWRGSRSINNMILDEDLQVPAMPIADNDIPHPLTKEEITFPKAAIIDVGSLELCIVAAVWKESAATKHSCHEEVELEKYDHSFLSSPDHVSEFEESWESEIETDFPNKKQRMESHASNTWLKRSNFNDGNGESVEHYGTEVHEDQRTKSYSATTLEHVDQGDTPKYPEYVTLEDVHVRDVTPQIVPDMFVQDQLKAQPMKDSPRAVPSGADDITMDTTNASLHLDDYPQRSHSTFGQREVVKGDSYITPVPCDQGLPAQTSMLATQGRRKLRVGLSKSTRVKPLHPYWSKERIK